MTSKKLQEWRSSERKWRERRETIPPNKPTSEEF